MPHNTSHDSETPAQEQQIITAVAFIYHTFAGTIKVFLPKRADTKKFLPGIYELPGGHIEFGEDIVVGLKREVMEEFEVEINVGDPFYVFTYMNAIKGSHSIEVIYFATFLDPIENIRIHADDHSEFRWFAEDELATVINSKGSNDGEVRAILKGFKLLKKV